jgi:cytochrome c biogenesis protein CcmG, thiol:disulfide interchange protein DsbE
MRTARLTGQVVALAAVAALLGILIWHLTHRPPPPKIGAPAPAFSLGRLDGSGTLALASLRGRTVVLNFWASWCPPCKREAPALEQLWHEYRGKGVVFVGIDANDAASDGRRFLRAHGITYPTVHDAHGLVAANRYNVDQMPVTYFIDKEGRLVDEPLLGPVSEKRFADAFRRRIEAAIES